MNDLDEVRKRIEKRRGSHRPLNDANFKRFYNFMVKFMVVIVVTLVSMSYVKLNPDSKIKEMILNDANYQAITTWITDSLFSFLPDKQINVSNEVVYQSISGDYYKNDSNEVIAITNGRVIETGSNQENSSYIIILGDDEVAITYDNIENLTVTLYDQVEQGTILGTYQQQLKLQFEYLGQEISYEEYQRMG
ncbi:M23 family metallopeptidase [uncultured Thomasclavelia sp.]|uniref:M23 family metallopeptidase n=1 Tax=uncultured Thomasclavelia sp. TaxID=3025759 RepID=UPI0025D5C95D|nr:M23 family metallopeptidase [uncultured Thomasclavelia sp.]